MRKILIISQARFGSTRLPGKVLLKVLDKPLIWYLIKRLQLVKTPCNIIIATAISEQNKPIINIAKTLNLDYFAGSEDDVLDRFYRTAKQFKGDIIVRITADCPLMDPAIIDRGLKIFLNGNYDYVSNVEEGKETYPDGFDIEIFSFKALKVAWKKAKWQSEREHVTPYIRKNDKFKKKYFKNDENFSNFRLTVDTKEDFDLISIIIEKFYDRLEKFTLKEVIDFLRENLDLLKINEQYMRNEGYTKSLREDKLIGNE
jgi:spore coat polysaccharide biosynthesis protein SpsF (cytidylyltransferase family)